MRWQTFSGITYNDIVSNKRSRNIAHPRQVAIYLCRELLESTFKAIGEEFNRDHSTIMHSYDLISNALKEDRNLREEIEAIQQKNFAYNSIKKLKHCSKPLLKSKQQKLMKTKE